MRALGSKSPGAIIMSTALAAIAPVKKLISESVGFFTRRSVSTPTSYATRAPCDPSEVTTWVPSDAYMLGVTRRPSGACSAFT